MLYDSRVVIYDRRTFIYWALISYNRRSLLVFVPDDLDVAACRGHHHGRFPPGVLRVQVRGLGDEQLGDPDFSVFCGNHERIVLQVLGAQVRVGTAVQNELDNVVVTEF